MLLQCGFLLRPSMPHIKYLAHDTLLSYASWFLCGNGYKGLTCLTYEDMGLFWYTSADIHLQKKEEEKSERWFAFVQFFVQQCLESYLQFSYFNLMCLLCSCRITFIWSSPAEASVTPLGKSENCIWCTIIHNNQCSSLLVYLVQTWKPFQKNVDQIGWHISNMIYNFFLMWINFPQCQHFMYYLRFNA